MTTDTAAAESTRRTVALVLGKTGMHISVNGARPRQFPFKGTLNAASLVKKLRDVFVSQDHPSVNILLIGTRSDGQPGWDAIDPRELEQYAGDSLNFTTLSEAQALHESFTRLPDDKNFLIYRAKTGTAVAQNAPQQERHTHAYLVFATATRPGATEPVGSARCWVQQEASVVLADVFCSSTNFGQIYTIQGGSIVTTPSMVVALVEDLIRQYPSVTRVLLWSQDGMSQYPAYEPMGAFWRYLRPAQGFIEADGEIIVARNALALASLASTAYSQAAKTATASDAKPHAQDKPDKKE